MLILKKKPDTQLVHLKSMLFCYMLKCAEYSESQNFEPCDSFPDTHPQQVILKLYLWLCLEYE